MTLPQFLPVANIGGHASLSAMAVNTDAIQAEINAAGGGVGSYLVNKLLTVTLVTGEQSVSVSGYWMAGGEAASVFVKVPRGRLFVDYGIIFPTSDTNYVWQRSFSGPVDPRWYGGIGDGAPHPLSEHFATLLEAQAWHSFVTSLTEETDWAALTALIQSLPSDGGSVWLSGQFVANIDVPNGTANLNIKGANSGFSLNGGASQLIGSMTLGDHVENLQLEAFGFTGPTDGIIVPAGRLVAKLDLTNVSFSGLAGRAIDVKSTGLVIGCALHRVMFNHCLEGIYTELGAVINNLDCDGACMWLNPRDGGHMAYLAGLAGTLEDTNIALRGTMNGFNGSTCTPVFLGRLGTVDLTQLHFADWGVTGHDDPAWGLPLILLGHDGFGAGVLALRVSGDIANVRGAIIAFDASVVTVGTVELCAPVNLAAGGAYPPIADADKIGHLVSLACVYSGGAQMKNPIRSEWINDTDYGPIGNLTCPAGATLVDGKVFTISSIIGGVLTPLIYEFNSGGGVLPGHVAVPFTAGDTIKQVRDNLVTAIHAQKLLGTTTVDAVAGGPGLVALVGTDPNVLNYVPVTTDFVAVGWAVAGMTGVLPDVSARLGRILAPVALLDTRAVLPEENGACFLCSKAGWQIHTLPVAGSIPKGRGFTFKKISAGGGVRIDRAGSDLVDGGANFALYNQWDCVELLSNGIDAWYVVSDYKRVTQADSAALDVPGLRTDFNTLLATLRG